MIDSKNLLSDAELDKVAGGMTEKDAAGVVYGILHSEGLSFVFGGIKYALNPNWQRVDQGVREWMISEIMEAERFCTSAARGDSYENTMLGHTGKQIFFTAVKL